MLCLTSLVGGFTLDKITHGKIAGFNMWSERKWKPWLSSDMKCDMEGDLVGPNDLDISGGSYIQEQIRCSMLSVRALSQTVRDVHKSQ